MSCPHSLAKGSRSRCRPMTTSADVDLCGTDRRTGSWERHASSPCTTTAYDPQGVDHPRSRHRSPASKGSCRHRARTPRVGDLSHLVTTSVRTAHRPLCAHHAAHGPRSSFASWRTSTFSTTTASTPTEPTSLPSFATTTRVRTTCHSSFRPFREASTKSRGARLQRGRTDRERLLL